ncbi:hypothetical protein E2C01_092701 [Portunus trituberculatus]|uniref:Uncharacterized protein n=1 Tax=Portunus trituberculatus TaxID=210409 RepID=A0A5B7JWL2_PORTR|nr:hypothetical protein [Portunus trituberculatus]
MDATTPIQEEEGRGSVVVGAGQGRGRGRATVPSRVSRPLATVGRTHAPPRSMLWRRSLHFPRALPVI